MKARDPDTVPSLDGKSRAALERFVSRFRVTRGKGFRLRDFDPGDTAGLKSEFKAEARESLRRGVTWLAQQQEMLYAQDHWAVLLVFQAMDAAGKDGTIRHVMSGVNPQGCSVASFKQPSAEELDHDYLWRYGRHLPARGQIGIFNRSYYEEVLVVRTHPELLEAQKLPEDLVSKRIWKERLEDIAAHERYLARNGVLVLKFFLHLSREEQRRRFLARLDEPDKHWKFSAADVRERAFWDRYQDSYEDAIRATAAAHAPWFVVPADNKWFSRLVVVSALVGAIDGLRLAYPTVDASARADLDRARAQLAGEASGAARSRGRRRKETKK
jgi:PPK2 family polyphosphate:nucleotide phosphotransferase